LKVGAIIQARLTSSRFPKKILAKIDGKPVIQWCVENVLKAKEIYGVIVASPHKLPIKLPVRVFIGNEKDVLKRYYDCATKYKFDIIVRITADCPFIDPKIIDLAVKYYKSHKYEYVCFAPVDGLDVEVFSYALLARANFNAHAPYEREHVTPYMRMITKLSVDTAEDLERARRWYELHG